MIKILFFSFLFFSFCSLEDIGQDNSIYFSSRKEEFKETSTSTLIQNGFLSIFLVTEEDIKKIDNLALDYYKNKLPSEVLLNLDFQPTKNNKLKNIKVILKEGSIQKNNQKGIYQYEVILTKGEIKRKLSITYRMSSAKQIQQNISQFTEEDIKQWDGIIRNVNTLASTLTPTFILPAYYKGLSNFKVEVVGLPIADDDFGNYKYKARVIDSTGNFKKEILVSYIGFFKPKIYVNMVAFKTITDHTDRVFSLSYSPDGTKFVSGSADDSIKMWNSTGTLLRTLTSGGSGDFNTVDFSPAGSTFASGSDDNKIRIWNSTGTLIRTLTDHNRNVASVSYSSDGTKIASGSNNSVKIWNARTYSVIHSYNSLDGFFLRSVDYSPDGTGLLISKRTVIYVLNLNTFVDKGANLAGDPSSNFVYSPDGKQAVSAQDGHPYPIVFWKIRTDISPPSLTTFKYIKNPFTGNNPARFVFYSPDGTKIIAGSSNGDMKIWDVATGTLIKSFLNAHTDAIRSIVFSPDGKQMVSASEDNNIKIWK